MEGINKDILERVSQYKNNIQQAQQRIQAAKAEKYEEVMKAIKEKQEKNAERMELEALREENIKRRERERNLDEIKRWEILRGINNS